MTQELGPNQKTFLGALRSGRFNRGFGGLNVGGHHCLLGVACESLLPKDAKSKTVDGGWYGEFSFAPLRLIELLALRNKFGSDPGGRYVKSLISLNLAYTFDEAANLIESDPAVYFTEPR